jgi:hypothetical protein
MASMAEVLDQLDLVTGEAVGFRFEPDLPPRLAMRYIRRALWQMAYFHKLEWTKLDGEYIVLLRKFSE